MTAERDSTMTFCEGKYALVRHSDGRMEALRYGVKWRDLTGDNLIAAMADALDAHLAALQSLEVTPDIVNVATAAYNDEIDICDDANVDYVDETYMRIALLAVLSSLKEQAK